MDCSLELLHHSGGRKIRIAKRITVTPPALFSSYSTHLENMLSWLITPMRHQIPLRICLIFLTLPSFLLVHASQSHTSATVHTNFGSVQGHLIHLNIAGLKPVIEYLGVPYAMPPLGRKRFMPPNSPSKWSVTKDCTRLPPACVQKFPNSFLAGESEALKWMPAGYYHYLQRVRASIQSESEDCLYLNLYVPERKGRNQETTLLPVLVLIHGGSYSWGSGNLYNASVLASHGQIIVVTLNYRLGIFGFLSAGYQAPICRGNWALGDIAAALEFLRQTITDFGGDPGLITLLGWDSGAALINLLMSSPISAPAHSRSFQRAVLLGGSALSAWATVSNPTHAFFYVAEALGCAKLRKDQRLNTRSVTSPDSPIHSIINCLSSVPVENLTRVTGDMEPPTYLNIFGPTVDGSIVANDPQHNLRQHGNLFRQLDLLVGLTRNEAFHLLNNQDLIKGVDEGKRNEIYRTLVQNMFHHHRNEIFSSIVNQYTDWQAPDFRRDDIRDAILKALGDGLYVAPLINAARIHSQPNIPFSRNHLSITYKKALRETTSSSPTHGATYVYLFSHSTKGLDRGRLQESIHGEDLPYILGYPLMARSKGSIFDYNFGELERALSEAMMTYIANFVKSGDPTRPSPVQSNFGDSSVTNVLSRMAWSPFVADISEGYLELSERPSDHSYYRAHEVAFWTKFLPSLEKAGETAGDEKHNLFPASATFYGVVRPADRFGPIWRLNTTTPGPSVAPTQPQGSPTSSLESDKATSTQSPSPLQEKYSTILSVTVAVGCALLILNILIFAGIYHQWDKRKRFRKRLENHYQPAPTAQMQPAQMDLGLMQVQVQTANATANSPGSIPIGHGSLDRSQAAAYSLAMGPHRVPPAPPPPAPVSSMVQAPGANASDVDVHPTLSLRPNQGRQSIRQHHQSLPSVQFQQQPGTCEIPGTPRGLYSEQEPLLNKTYISPTCPRHGRQAVAAMAGNMSSLEEIQV